MKRKLLEKLADHFSDSALWHDADETMRLSALVKAELNDAVNSPVGYINPEHFGGFMFENNKSTRIWKEKKCNGISMPLYAHQFQRLNDDDILGKKAEINDTGQGLIDCHAGLLLAKKLMVTESYKALIPKDGES